jgi:small subunit ribosomal protein S2
MLTNFKTIRQSVKRLHELEAITTEDSISEFTKKELLVLSREREKLERSLGGIKHMESLPDVVFIVDVGHEEIAVREAKKLGIAVVAVVDTNCSPDDIDYLVPGNDDAMRSIDLYVSGIADAVLKGKASIPEVPSGEDDFVELDEEGRPKGSDAKSRPRARSKKSVQVTKKSSTRKAIVPKEDAPAQGPSQEIAEPAEPTSDEPVVQVEQAEDAEDTKVLQSSELPEEEKKPAKKTKKKVAKKKPTSKKIAITKKKKKKKAAPKKTSSEGAEES